MPALLHAVLVLNLKLDSVLEERLDKSAVISVIVFFHKSAIIWSVLTCHNGANTVLALCLALAVFNQEAESV